MRKVTIEHDVRQSTYFYYIKSSGLAESDEVDRPCDSDNMSPWKRVPLAGRGVFQEYQLSRDSELCCDSEPVGVLDRHPTSARIEHLLAPHRAQSSAHGFG